VPDDFGSIQAALDGATAGDIIIARNGTYTGAGNKNLDFKGKALTLRSENGADNCTIDCEGDGRGFSFQSGESEASIIEGFTVANGAMVSGDGGGIYCWQSSPSIVSCKFVGNSAVCGGGIASSESSPSILSCEFIGNSAECGGALYIAGYLTEELRPDVRETSFRLNQAVYGGALYATGFAGSQVVDCLLTGNSALWWGGGVFDYSGCSTCVNCTISENDAYWGGGAIYFANRPGGYGSATLTNSILWENAALFGKEICVANTPECSFCGLYVTSCNVQGGRMLAYVEVGATLGWEANIETDPAFLEAGSYHLSSFSPCIDAGADAQTYTETDIDGDFRPQGDGYDIGVDEYVPPAGLAQINLQAPGNGATLGASPTFTWIADGGDDNAFAVDVALSPSGPFYSTYDTLHQIIRSAGWAMPPPIWNMIPSGSRVYWRARGTDLSVTPLSIITSDEVWSFYKQ
jgi:predicted outer membrane repeat protein